MSAKTIPSAFTPFWQVCFLVTLALVLRLYRVTNPIADWHSFRQADTASVTREYVKHGIDLLRPKYLDHSNIQTGKDNPEGYRLVEFPLVNGVVAGILKAVPSLSLELTSRLFSIFMSLISIIALYGLVKNLSGERLAFWASLAMAVLPYSVYYSRTTQPEPTFLALSLVSLYALERYLQKANLGWWLLTLLALAGAFLLKPFVVFLAPVFAWLAFQKRGFKIFWSFDLIALGALSIVPLYFWREWIKTFPTGIPASDWLFNGNGIRFRPAWFRWLFLERITKLILGWIGIIFVLLNVIDVPKLKTKLWWQQDWSLYAAWWLGILTYFSVMASGNVQHDYYQVIAIPIIAISLSRGLLLAEKQLQNIWPLLKQNLVPGIGLCLSAAISWQYVGGYFNINHWEYIEAGRVVDQQTPAAARVIAPAFGDTTFLFQTNRTGWPIGFEIADKISKGATHYVTTSYDDEARQLEKTYSTLVKTEKYLLLDLTKPLP